jgi:hypothetical protein
MNIFVLDLDPKKCAQYHSNSHVVKMVLETAQLLCGVHWVSQSSFEIPYKLSHKNHPCAIWARECMENYVWLCDLGMELSKEYTYRYGKRHKSQDVIEWCMINNPNIKTNGDLTPFAMAMPDECKIGPPVASYRQYYMTEKRAIAKWTKRETPIWYK